MPGTMPKHTAPLLTRELSISDVILAKKLDRPEQDLILTTGILTIDMSSVYDEDGGEDGITDASSCIP